MKTDKEKLDALAQRVERALRSLQANALASTERELKRALRECGVDVNAGRKMPIITRAQPINHAEWKERDGAVLIKAAPAQSDRIENWDV